MANYIIFGGTFDPVHNGHLRVATFAAEKLNANVIFVPAKSPRWKTPLSSVEDRVEMLKLAIKELKIKAYISDFEINSASEVNYSIDTVRYLKNKYPSDNLYFLIGADQVDRFDEWKDAEELSQLVRIAFVNRPNIKLDNANIDKYHMLDLTFDKSGEVSSSDVRELKSIDIPDSVREYIEVHRLYYVSKLAAILNKPRLEHSFEVAKLALKIARVNNLEHEEYYYCAGLLHDAGKNNRLTVDETISFMNQYYPEYVNLPKFAYHQFIGAYIAENEFNIDNSEIIEAIKFHCTGVDNMSNLAMVVYAADKIEPTRDFDSTWLINSCLANWRQGFLDTLEDNKKYLLNHNKDITNELTDRCFKMYLEEKE